MSLVTDTKSVFTYVYIIDSNYLASRYISSLLSAESYLHVKTTEISRLDRRGPVDTRRCLVIVDQFSVSAPLIPYGQKLKACFPDSGLLVIGEHDFCSRLQRIFQPWVLAVVEYDQVKGLRRVVAQAADLLSEVEPSSLIHEPSPRPFLLQHAGISKRELEIFELLCLRLSNKEIASLLDITVATVKFHVSNIFAKTNVRRRREFFSKMDAFKGPIELNECRPRPAKSVYMSLTAGSVQTESIDSNQRRP